MTENVPDPARPPRPRHVVDGDDFEADLDDDPPAAPGSRPAPEPVAPERAAPANFGHAPAAPPQKKRRPFWIELPILILIAFGLTFLIQTFIAKVYYVPSGSMEQTLHGVASGGDRILANKVVYDFRDPAQGDVVVFAGPPSWVPETRIAEPTSWIGSALQSLGSVVGIAPPNEKDYVKRVIAVGGQTVQCCDAQAAVAVGYDRRPGHRPRQSVSQPVSPLRGRHHGRARRARAAGRGRFARCRGDPPEAPPMRSR